jgi:hypothetical protein
MTSGTSSWPWLKGVEVAVADPIPPVNQYDDRPSVKELIEKHRQSIDQVQLGLKDDPLYDLSKHDDLWILRFVLSHKPKTSRKTIIATANENTKWQLSK